MQHIDNDDTGDSKNIICLFQMFVAAKVKNVDWGNRDAGRQQCDQIGYIIVSVLGH